MTNINEEFIEKYLRKLVPENKTFLKELETYAKENHVPIIEEEVAQFLKVQVKIQKAKKILEIGTAIGYSALVMADALDGNCQITSLERRSDMVELARENIEKSPYKDKIQIIEGEADQLLKDLQGPYDLIFMDAAKGQYMEFFKSCQDLIRPGGLIIADNVLFRGMVASDELLIRRKITIVKRLREFLKNINQLDDYTASVVPIGDGMALIYREV